MKRTLLLIVLALTTAVSASAQWFDFSSNERLDVGFNIGRVAHNTPYARMGYGVFVNAWGVYLDFMEAFPQHRFNRTIQDTQWEDDKTLVATVGYQIPILPWVKIMPLAGYVQTSEGLTDGSTLNIGGVYQSRFYHNFNVTPGSRVHYFNFGGGLSIQPLSWLSINGIFTRYAIYGGVGINIMALRL